MTTELLTERRDATLVLTLNGPATRNSLTPQVCAAGIETLNMAEANPDVHSVVLTGAGEHFCSGVDRTDPNAADEAWHAWAEALRVFPKPVLVATEGQAAGAGMGLALAGDLIVAAESTRFQRGSVAQGLRPEDHWTERLPSLIGRPAALALLWLDDAPALSVWVQRGLVHRVVPGGQALDQALTLAAQLNQLPPTWVAQWKERVSTAG